MLSVISVFQGVDHLFQSHDEKSDEEYETFRLNNTTQSVLCDSEKDDKIVKQHKQYQRNVLIADVQKHAEQRKNIIQERKARVLSMFK